MLKCALNAAAESPARITAPSWTGRAQQAQRGTPSLSLLWPEIVTEREPFMRTGSTRFTTRSFGTLECWRAAESASAAMCEARALTTIFVWVK